jgi:hypothetical protein
MIFISRNYLLESFVAGTYSLEHFRTRENRDHVSEHGLVVTTRNHDSHLQTVVILDAPQVSGSSPGEALSIPQK